jgi:hypothetical protein
LKYDDETLMAFVDGELDASRREEIEAAIARDPALARQVEQQRVLRATLASAFSKVLEARVPDRLETAARGTAAPAAKSDRGKVLEFPVRTARAPAAPWRAREWTAMAASLLVGVLLSWRFFGSGGASPVIVGKDGLLAHGELALALDRQLASEQQGDERVLIGLTFKARDGNYCRSFSMHATRTAGLACRSGSAWRITATESSVEPGGAAMQQAGSALPPSILRIIESRMEGTALDAEGEKNAQESAWDPAPAGGS